MTDHPMLPDDELVSAVLDGEATPAEVARVERDPVLAARLAELRAVAEAVGTPVPPLADDRVDDLVARALDAAATDGPAASTAPPVPVIDLDARRRRRTRWLAAAAVAAVALVGVPLALASREGTSQQFAAVGSAVAGDDGGAATDAAAPESAEELTADAESSARASQAPAPTTTALPYGGAAFDESTASSLTLPAAGEVASATDLLRWAAALDLPATTTSTGALERAVAAAGDGVGGATGCTAVAIDPVLGWAAATSAGAPAEVWVLGVPVGPTEVRTRLVLVDAATCSALLTVEPADG